MVPEQGLSLCPQIRGSSPRVQAESWGSGLPSTRYRHRWGRRPVSGRAQLELASSACAPRGPRRPLLHQVLGCRPSRAFHPFPQNPPQSSSRSCRCASRPEAPLDQPGQNLSRSPLCPVQRPGGSSLPSCGQRTVDEKQQIRCHTGNRSQTQSQRKAETPGSCIYPALTSGPQIPESAVGSVNCYIRGRSKSGQGSAGNGGGAAPPAGGYSPPPPAPAAPDGARASAGTEEQRGRHNQETCTKLTGIIFKEKTLHLNKCFYLADLGFNLL